MNLSESDWKTLLKRIDAGRCTPFLGAGAAAEVIPSAQKIAQDLASDYGYPLDNDYDLANVAQFVAVKEDAMVPKEQVIDRWFSSIEPPSFDDEGEPHGTLARLPISVFMTTNYDDLMVQALKDQHKNPVREICRWNQFVRREPASTTDDWEPTPANPLVFHLHGQSEIPESLVLTEDDYLDFLVSLSRDPQLLDPVIQKALTGSSLLFVGYSLKDWDFRVLFRGMVAAMESGLRRMSVSVQLLPVPESASEADRGETQSFLDRYFDGMNVRVYWGTARQFSAELRQRWERFKSESSG